MPKGYIVTPIGKDPDVKGLDKIVEYTLSTGSTYGTFLDALDNANKLKIVPGGYLMKQQLRIPLVTKLLLVKEGKFNDFSEDYDNAIYALKQYLYDPPSRQRKQSPTHQEKIKVLDFMLDFILVTSLAEYPLQHPAEKIKESAAAMYLVALPYLAKTLVDKWRDTRNDLRIKGKGTSEFFRELNSLEKMVWGLRGPKYVLDYGNLVVLTNKYDDVLVELRDKIKQALEVFSGDLTDKNIDKIKFLMEKADRIHEVMELSEKLSQMYKVCLNLEGRLEKVHRESICRQ